MRKKKLERERKLKQKSDRPGPPLWIFAAFFTAILVIGSITRSGGNGIPVDSPFGIFVMLGIFASSAKRIYRRNGNRVWYWQQILFICIELVVAIFIVLCVQYFHLNTYLTGGGL